jgi:hypothetical protein
LIPDTLHALLAQRINSAAPRSAGRRMRMQSSPPNPLCPKMVRRRTPEMAEALLH